MGMLFKRYRRPLTVALLVLSALLFISAIYRPNDSVSNLYHKIKFPGIGISIDPASPPAASSTISSIFSAPPSHPTPNDLPSTHRKTQQTAVPQVSNITSSDFSALHALCSQTQWTQGLWLHCHSTCGSDHTSVCGGLNNARNRIQTCIRYAIDAGAGIIMPSVSTRSESHLKDTDGGRKLCPSLFWDTQYLKGIMQQQCPQFSILLCDDRAGINKVIQAPHRDYLDRPHSKGTFREMVNDTLFTHGIHQGSMLRDPVVVNFADSLMGWSYSRSGELSTIRKDLYKALQYNHDLLDISYQILQHPQLDNGEFIGVHLRGEKDWPENFGSREDQMRLYKQEIESIQNTGPNQIKTLYVSSGDAEVIESFRETLTPLGYTVHDKWTLLEQNPELLDKVNGLRFDQKGVVEFETLVSSKYFLGPAMSSMSSLIAYERTINETEDIFTKHIFPGSVRDEETRWRTYPTTPAMLGDETTKLMVVNQFDIMDNFP